MDPNSTSPKDTVKWQVQLSAVVSSSTPVTDKILPEDDRNRGRLSLSTKYAATFGIMAAYFGVTLVLGMVGPSLLDLQILTSTTTSEISTVFTCRGVLAIISSLMMGPVLDTINHLLVVAISLLALFVFLAVTPWSDSLITILLTMGPPEFFSCAIGMGIHMIGLELWQENAGPIMQGLNFVSIVGFMVAPLLVQPFLADVIEASSISNATLGPKDVNFIATIVPWDESHDDYVNSVIVADRVFASRQYLSPDIEEISDSANINKSMVSVLVPVSQNSSSPINHAAVSTTYIKYAYWIAAGYCWVIGVIVLFVFSKTGFKLRHEREDVCDERSKDNTSNVFKAVVATLFFFFNICLAGIEVGYAGLLLTFAVTYFGWSKESGTWLSALLQASNCLVTALCIPLSRYISPNKLLGVDLLILNAVLIAETAFVKNCPSVLWACTAGIGAGYAVVMPSSLTWIDTFMEVSGKFSSVYWAGYFVGFMTVPALSGFLFHHVHPLCFVYVTLGCAAGMAILFVVLSAIVRRHQVKCTTVTNGSDVNT